MTDRLQKMNDAYNEAKLRNAEQEQFQRNEQIKKTTSKKYDDIITTVVKGLMFELDIPKDKFVECQTFLNSLDIKDIPILTDRILELHYISEIVKEHLKRFQYRDEFEELIDNK